MLSYPHSPGHYMTLPATPTIIATIDALSKSNGIQNLKITNLCGHHLFDSSMDPALLAGVNDDDKDNDEHTSLAGVHDEDTESNHNSIDPNEANDNSMKASIHSTRSHMSVHSATNEPPQHPPDEEDNLNRKCTKEAPWMIAKRMSPTLHLLLFAQSM